MYNYEEMKSEVFKEENQEMFLKILENSKTLIEQAGVATLGKIISKVCGDSFVMLACVDRLVEIGKLKEVKQAVAVQAQNRIFTF